MDTPHVAFSKPHATPLIQTNVDASDFFLANGGFTPKKYELLSYMTGSVRFGNSSLYATPPGQLPLSETAAPSLDLVGSSFANLPPRPDGYVTRGELEEELRRELLNDRRFIITLVGRGGTGKTSLALETLHKSCIDGDFEAVLWFSARDIDLLPTGPKPVEPDVLTAKALGRQLAAATEPQHLDDPHFDAERYMADALSGGARYEGLQLASTLFVFDNFETMRGAVDLYRWIDTFIRYPFRGSGSGGQQ